MKNLVDLGAIIESEIGKLPYPESPDTLYSPIEYIMGMRGKRMRPILVLMAHQLFDENLDKAISPALSIEMFHNFTLLHDDIMDKAPLRRGNETVHERWDDNVAILSGDTMMIQSYQLLCKVDDNKLRKVLDVFSKAATEVCEGQQWDMNFETQNNVEISEYIKMIEYKTAVLLAAALQIGGITGGASIQDQENLYEFGRNIGIAFQLKDDLLDVFGNPDTFGKQVGGDIMSNKKTYMYLKALELASDKQKKELEKYFSISDASTEKVDAVKKIFNDLKIQSIIIDLMKEYQMKAMVHLDAIKSSNKEPLIAFSEKLMDRIS